MNYKLEKSSFGGSRIVIPKKEKVKNKFPLPDDHVMGCIVGASGSGKTYILLSIIPLITKLKYLIICSKIIGNQVYEGINSYCNDNNIEYKFSNEVEEASDEIEKVINKKKSNEYFLIIFDDFCPSNSYSRSEPHTRLVIQTYQMLRNFKCHAITITQSYTGVPTLVRNNLNLLIVFKMNQTNSINRCALDFSNMTGRTDKEFYELYKEILKEKYSYILINDVSIYLYKPSNGEILNEVRFIE